MNQIVWPKPNVSVTLSDSGRTIRRANTGRRLQYGLRFEF
jgi:hypothetical protein